MPAGVRVKRCVRFVTVLAQSAKLSYGSQVQFPDAQLGTTSVSLAPIFRPAYMAAVIAGESVSMSIVNPNQIKKN